MNQIFIELFNYKDSWRKITHAECAEYADAVLGAVTAQREGGVEIVGWGFNNPATSRRAPYDFHCVYLTPSVEHQRRFEAEIDGAGSYDRFEQVTVSGAFSTPALLLRSYVRLDTAAGPAGRP